MPISTINNLFGSETGQIRRQRGAYPLLLWISAVLFMPSPFKNADSKPQIRKEIFKNFSVRDSVQTLEKYSVTEYNIFGNVIQFTDYRLNDRGKAEIHVQTLHKYDQQGNRIGTHKYDVEGNLIWSEDVLLDAQGRKNRVNSASYSPVHQHSYTLYEYDNYGNEIGVKNFNDKDQQMADVFRAYNQNGELLTVNQWFYVLEEDKLVKKDLHTQNEFNDLGQIVRSSTEIQIGRNKWREVQLFENGYLSEWFKYENGKMTSQYKHQKRDTVSIERNFEVPPPMPFQDPFMEYDDAKRDPLEHIIHTPISTTTIKQDQDGNIVKKVVREMNEVVQVSYFDYDEFNNLIHLKTINKRTEDTEETFRQYDHHRNLTREKVLWNGNTIRESSFEYEYYE